MKEGVEPADEGRVHCGREPICGRQLEQRRRPQALCRQQTGERVVLAMRQRTNLFVTPALAQRRSEEQSGDGIE